MSLYSDPQAIPFARANLMVGLRIDEVQNAGADTSQSTFASQ